MSAQKIIQSVSRAIDILECIAESESGLRLNEIASVTGLKKNTAHTLVQTLVARGYVEKTGAPLYRLGAAVADMGGRFSEGKLFTQCERVMLQCQETQPRATWVVSRRAGGDIAVILRMSPDRPGVMQRPQGATFHPYSNASGLALMAFLPEEETQSLREHYPFYEFGAHLWDSPANFQEYLQDVQNKGYAVPPFPDQKSFRVAVPLPDDQDNVVAALGASVSNQHVENTDDLVDLVINAAQDITSSVKQ
ncbi:MAG: IclR family transcriptional regulator [Candidatus Brocadiia bacterium]